MKLLLVVLAFMPAQTPQQPPLPCLPLPLPPICLPPEPPPPTDRPPEFVGALEIRRVGVRVNLDWLATDDIRLLGFRVFRDGNYLGSKGPAATHVRIRIPCGRHRFRVEAVDSVQQTVSVVAYARRRCI